MLIPCKTANFFSQIFRSHFIRWSYQKHNMNFWTCLITCASIMFSGGRIEPGSLASWTLNYLFSAVKLPPLTEQSGLIFIQIIPWSYQKHTKTIKIRILDNRIKSVSLEYSCDDEYLEEFDKGKVLEYSLLLATLPRNRPDPDNLQ